MFVLVINKPSIGEKTFDYYMIRHEIEVPDRMPLEEIKKKYYADYHKTSSDKFVLGANRSAVLKLAKQIYHIEE